MKAFLLSSTLFLLVSSAFGSVESLTPSEAILQVESEMAFKKVRDEEKRSELLLVPAESERKKSLEDGGILRLRRVSPPSPSLVRQEVASRQLDWTGGEIGEFLFWEAGRKAPQNISLSVTVYDGEVSEIRLWHEGEVYMVLSNVPFSHLQALAWFEDDQARWNLFAIVEEVNEEEEQQKSVQARLFVAEFHPRERPDTDVFTSSDEPEYIVLPVEEQTVPEPVFAKLDALHTYYLVNEKELAVEHQHREALAEARRRYREEHPPVAQDVIINFWRESEE
ncbi:hypothetical protein [Puniceicoccus vermicola]|uniref:DUF4384 domain-containing protein n=1 Tax=Puniceicoccus vermicola TaxID=388746 RepID=A0A7X1E558_9BACT|nr:hypothetical protein [Puniceicoccus vermicola]MBC2603305.1 hypothetical protein [Puniceicoccus vermicola]